MLVDSLADVVPQLPEAHEAASTRAVLTRIGAGCGVTTCVPLPAFGERVAWSHQLASHCHTLRLASPDHNGFQGNTGHFAGPAVDHGTVAHRRVCSGWQVNYQSTRSTYTHRHVITL
jgi:hypothetical protein